MILRHGYALLSVDGYYYLEFSTDRCVAISSSAVFIRQTGMIAIMHLLPRLERRGAGGGGHWAGAVPRGSGRSTRNMGALGATRSAHLAADLGGLQVGGAGERAAAGAEPFS
jgi:hypothetical protein